MLSSPGSLETRHGALYRRRFVEFVSNGETLVFYAAAFPRLTRNTPNSCSLHERYENGHISFEEYEREESLEKNTISNISVVGPGISPTRDSILIHVHQVHSNWSCTFEAGAPPSAGDGK